MHLHFFLVRCRFTVAEDISSQTAIKSSIQRSIKKSITDQYPPIEPYIDDIIPKKGDVLEGKGCVNENSRAVSPNPGHFHATALIAASHPVYLACNNLL